MADDGPVTKFGVPSSPDGEFEAPDDAVAMNAADDVRERSLEVEAPPVISPLGDWTVLRLHSDGVVSGDFMEAIRLVRDGLLSRSDRAKGAQECEAQQCVVTHREG
jgi:hypothetical protein